MKLNKKPTKLYFLFLLAISISFMSCKSQAQITNKTEDMEKEKAENLYLMLRIMKNSTGDGFDILFVEKEIIDKQGNPLPTQQTLVDANVFRCQLLDTNGKPLFAQEQNAQFIYGDIQKEAILKFIIPLPLDAKTVIVAHESSDSEWNQIFSETIDR